MNLAGVCSVAGTAAFLAAIQPWTTSERAAQHIPPERLASGVLGSRVENKNGLLLGELTELIIDTRFGETRYAVISFGGAFGVHPNKTVVPALLLSPAEVKRDTWVLDVTWKQWEHVPTAQPDSEPDIRKATAYLTRLAFASSPNLKLTPPGRNSGPLQDPLSTQFAVTALFGKAIHDASGHSLGKISDLVIGMGKGKELFLVLSSRNKPLVVLPLTGITRRGGNLIYEGKCKTVPLSSIAQVRTWGERSAVELAAKVVKSPI